MKWLLSCLLSPHRVSVLLLSLKKDEEYCWGERRRRRRRRCSRRRRRRGVEKTAEKWKSTRHRSENGILKRTWKNRWVKWGRGKLTGKRTGPGVGVGHMRGKWRKWRLMCYQLCDISFMPQRIGLRPFTLSWGNRNSCAQERNMTTCTWVWLLLMINLTLILIWHCLPLSLKDCKNTDPKMTPSMKKRKDCTF